MLLLDLIHIVGDFLIRMRLDHRAYDFPHRPFGDLHLKPYLLDTLGAASRIADERVGTLAGFEIACTFGAESTRGILADPACTGIEIGSAHVIGMVGGHEIGRASCRERVGTSGGDGR